MYAHESAQPTAVASFGRPSHGAAYAQASRLASGPGAIGADEAAGLLAAAAWSAVEAVREKLALHTERQSQAADGEGGQHYAPRARGGHARPDLDIWGDCLSLSGERAYAEVFVDKDLVPAVELVVALVNARRPATLDAAHAARDEIIATARAILQGPIGNPAARQLTH